MGRLASPSLAKAAPGSSRQPIWCRSCREVGSGERAAPHRPAINHSYVARGQGAAVAAHAGRGREARVRCSCKLSPKCFQVKANQSTVTEHTRLNPAPVGTLMSVQSQTHPQIQKHIRTCSAYKAAHAKVSHPYQDTQTYMLATTMCACVQTHTPRQPCTHHVHSDPRTQIYLTPLGGCAHAQVGMESGEQTLSDAQG